MRVAILGAGHGGTAASIDLSLRGFGVTLCSAINPSHIAPLKRNKGVINYSGEFGSGSVQVQVTNSVRNAVEDADVIMITTPSTNHEVYARILGKSLRTPKPILLNGCTTGGAIYVQRILRECGLSDPVVCEMNTLAYVSRLEDPTHVHIYHKMDHLLLAIFPSKFVDKTVGIMKEIYPEVELAKTVLETSLSNVNMLMHPPGVVLNAGWIEFTRGGFYFYSQGVTPAVGKVIERVDEERMTILRRMKLRYQPLVALLYKLGLTTVSDGSIYDALQASDANRTIKAPAGLNHRYLVEDVQYGLVPMASIAGEVGIETRTTHSLIDLACVLTHTNHWRKGLTVEKLGIKGIGLKGFQKYLYEGSA